MKLSTLKNKLTKAGIKFTVKDFNGFNQALIFSINNKTFSASYNTDKETVEDFATALGYDDANQETERRYFRSLTAVKKYAA
jgi:hypothetical protein